MRTAKGLALDPNDRRKVSETATGDHRWMKRAAKVIRDAKGRPLRQRPLKAVDKKTMDVVRSRSGGKCESCAVREATEADHVFGRSKTEESVETVWHLCHECHQAKTLNDPSASHWLAKFALHAKRHSYWDAHDWALEEILWRTAKKRTA